MIWLNTFGFIRGYNYKIYYLLFEFFAGHRGYMSNSYKYNVYIYSCNFFYNWGNTILGFVWTGALYICLVLISTMTILEPLPYLTWAIWLPRRGTRNIKDVLGMCRKVCYFEAPGMTVWASEPVQFRWPTVPDQFARVARKALSGAAVWPCSKWPGAGAAWTIAARAHCWLLWQR